MLTEITQQLSKIGIVQVIKNDFVFFLFMTKDKQDLSSNQIPFQVLEICSNYLGYEKPMIEIMKNEENYLILILKPKSLATPTA
ncbi:hypothetical protein [Flavobacterium geliluteum]|uniref:Uncharacterized protein n=1 Tax=Flavobacterium geliluteum TaxID=2816120 RepID=A0A941AWH1_9FLAO|nr:hypothetical protein [Flavobacterium geliluteum]MBP4139974.1 hypothetical protein [Flavobacterium geliluteum]